MRRAFIIPALLVISVFMVLVIGLLTKQPLRNLGAMQTLYQIQARQVAVAGIEEARLRLAGDINQSISNTTLSFEVCEAGTTTPLGSYLVVLDASWAVAPFRVLRVESEGFFGPSVKPLARYVIRATLDARPLLSPGNRNPKYLHVLRWQESVP